MKSLAAIGAIMILVGAILLYTSGRTGTNIAVLSVGVFLLLVAPMVGLK